MPVKIVEPNGRILGVAGVQALDEWMTEDYVPFRGELLFADPEAAVGYLIISKDNPSGLPEYDASLKMPIRFR